QPACFLQRTQTDHQPAAEPAGKTQRETRQLPRPHVSRKDHLLVPGVPKVEQSHKRFGNCLAPPVVVGTKVLQILDDQKIDKPSFPEVLVFFRGGPLLLRTQLSLEIPSLQDGNSRSRGPSGYFLRQTGN